MLAFVFVMSMSSLGGEEKRSFDVAVAIVDFHFAAGILDGDFFVMRAQNHVSRRIDNFQIA